MSLTLEQFIKDYLKRIDLTERRFDDVHSLKCASCSVPSSLRARTCMASLRQHSTCNTSSTSSAVLR